VPQVQAKKAEEFVYVDLKMNDAGLAQNIIGDNKVLEGLQNGDKVKVSLTVETFGGQYKTMEFDAIFYAEGGRSASGKKKYTFKLEKDLSADELAHVNEFAAQSGTNAFKTVSQDKLPGGGAKVHKG